MDNFFPVIAIVLLVSFGIVMLLFQFSRARSILELWADENRYEIVSSEHRWLGGPFWWRKGKGQEVYYVTVRTADGQVRRGWVRCGGWFLGVMSNAADVEWDE
jgi:hypothetical protein